MNKIRLLATNISCVTLAISASIASAQDAPGENTNAVFPVEYFAEYSPVTVNDMLDRIPGIDLILNQGPSNFRGGDRGLGAASPILINGKRLAGKANEARAQLARISASEVTSIEIIRGTSSSLDVQNVSQVVNIIMREAPSRSSITSEVNGAFHADGNKEPGGSIAWSGQRGGLTYLFSGSVLNGYTHADSYEFSVNGDFSPNDSRDQDRYTDRKTTSLNTNLTYALTDRDRLAFNALYNDVDLPQRVNRTITNYNLRPPVVSFERETIPATSDDWEIGGDYEHTFLSGNRLKALFIVNEKDGSTPRERFVSTPANPVETKNLFLDLASVYQERIVRGSYTMNIAEGHGLEMGIERAQTIQDSALRQGVRTNLPGVPAFGGLTPVVLPNAVSTVEEVRYEPFMIHNWQINPRMSLETSLVAEFSTIEQSGDVNNSRDFDYVKPKLDFRFDISETLQFRSSLENVVSQLSFADFSRNTNERDEDKDTVAGNPELVPEESWQAELGLDYRLPNDSGTLNTRYFYYRYDNKIGRIDIAAPGSPPNSTNGNLSSAAAYGLITNASIRLGFLGLPTALVTASATVQESEFHRDPWAPMEHGFPPYDRGGYRFGYRHDLPAYNMNYGVNYFTRINGNRTMFDIDNRSDFVIPSNLSLFIEKTGFAGLTYRLEAVNLEDDELCGDRRRYNGYIVNGSLKEFEYLCTRNGREITFRIRGTF